MEWRPTGQERQFFGCLGPPGWEPVVMREKKAHSTHRLGICFLESGKIFPETLAESQSDANYFAHHPVSDGIKLIAGQIRIELDRAILVCSRLKHSERHRDEHARSRQSYRPEWPASDHFNPPPGPPLNALHHSAFLNRDPAIVQLLLENV